MAQPTLAQDSPKVFQALARFLSSDELALVVRDYALAATLGGNEEPRLTREQGVSFNPRLARILSILIHDFAVRDIVTIRAALYCAVFDTGFSISAESASHPLVPLELKSLVGTTCARVLENEASAAIRGVIVLDSVRHLHQGEWSRGEREDILAQAQQTVQALVGAQYGPELILKLSHAITLQQRRESK